jgi:hypothetical protein
MNDAKQNKRYKGPAAAPSRRHVSAAKPRFRARLR